MLQTFPIVIITVCTARCLMRLFIKNQMSHTFDAIIKHCHWIVNVSALQCLNYKTQIMKKIIICYSLIEKSVRYLNMKIISISTMLNIENCKNLIASYARIEKNEQVQRFVFFCCFFFFSFWVWSESCWQLPEKIRLFQFFLVSEIKKDWKTRHPLAIQ